MGNTLTVITTIITIVQIGTSSKCVGPTDEKSEEANICELECNTYTEAASTLGLEICTVHMCHGLKNPFGHCRWDWEHEGVFVYLNIFHINY